jgi:type VI secretion system secreted protein VgrG
MTAPATSSASSTQVGEPVQPCAGAKHWVQIQLVDEEGKPVPRVRYQIEASDGTVTEGMLDGDGMGGRPELAGGQCTVRFPDLDAAAWELR